MSGRRDEAPVRADVGVADGRVVAIGALGDATAGRTIDATGMIVAPGFIDVHTHIERELVGGPHRHAAARMGVTTILTAPDGFGWTGLDRSLAEQMWTVTAFSTGSDALPRHWATPDEYLGEFVGRIPVNVIAQAPHNEIRLSAQGWSAAPADPPGLATQIRRLEAWFEAGAVGLCMGLDYQPGAFASYDELRALGEVTADRDGTVAAHVRYAALGPVGAWEEMMRLHADTGVRVHVSHEVVGPTTEPLLRRCDAEGIDLTFEAYLYPAGCTHLTMMLPLELQQGPPEAVQARLADPSTREAATSHLARAFSTARANEERIVTVATSSGAGVGIDLLAEAAGDPRAAAERAVDLIRREHPYVLALYHRGWSAAQREDILVATATHPRMMLATDGVYHGTRGHPRGSGCFPRFIRRFVRERKALTISQAVHRMAGAPAERFGIPDRGYLEPGMAADIVVFDLENVRDHATWDDPFATTTGMEHVLVAGTSVIEHDAPTSALPGAVLRRS